MDRRTWIWLGGALLADLFAAGWVTRRGERAPGSRPSGEPEASWWWRRAAATMVQVDVVYRLVPRPIRALVWLVPFYLADRLELVRSPGG